LTDQFQRPLRVSEAAIRDEFVTRMTIAIDLFRPALNRSEQKATADNGNAES
jgi:hypothetical protein